MQRKEVILKVRLGPWLDEAYIIFANSQEKFVNLQSTQQKIQQDSVGPAIEQLVEQIKQATTESVAKVAIAQVELGDLRSKISMPAKWLKGKSRSLCWGLVGMGSPRVNFGAKAQVLLYKYVKYSQVVVA